MAIKLTAYFQGFASKADGSASLRFTTNEISAEDFAELKRNLLEFGWLVFGNNATDIQLPKEPVIDMDSKSPSQRLRAVIFLNWKQDKSLGDFETYYRKEMDKKVEEYKEKLV